MPRAPAIASGELTPLDGSAPTAQRVLQVVWGFETFGGLEHHLTALSIALARRGRDVRVFTEAPVSAASPYVRSLRAAGIPVSGAGPWAALADQLGRSPLAGWHTAAVPLLRAAEAVRRARRPSTEQIADADRALLASRRFHPVTTDLFRRLDAAVTDAAPAVIHVHGTRLRQAWVVAWAAARGLPTVYTEHVTLDEWGGPIDDEAVRIMREHVGVLACVSERSRDSLRATLGPTVPVAVVRHVVDGPEVVPPMPVESTLRLICVARLERYKGIDTLLQALAIVRDTGANVELSLAGDGAERAALETLAATLDLIQVRFLGAVPPDQVGARMREAHVVVLPSRGEGLPVALVEAMANARAVVATRAGGNAEAVRDGETGLLVDAESPAQLAAALVRLAANRDEVARMGTAARHAWGDGGWTPNAVADATEALYRTAARRAAHG